jgi:hypothetical protein
MDELIKKYAERLQTIYDKQRAGDHTFSGILGDFLREVDGLRAIPHSKECKKYGHGLVTLGTPEACPALETTTTFES